MFESKNLLINVNVNSKGRGVSQKIKNYDMKTRGAGAGGEIVSYPTR